MDSKATCIIERSLCLFSLALSFAVPKAIASSPHLNLFSPSYGKRSLLETSEPLEHLELLFSTPQSLPNHLPQRSARRDSGVFISCNQQPQSRLHWYERVFHSVSTFRTWRSGTAVSLLQTLSRPGATAHLQCFLPQSLAAPGRLPRRSTY